MSRTDSHRPSVLKPAEYTWVGYTDDGDQFTARLSDGPLFVFGTDEPQRELRKECNPSGVRNEIHPGGCDACGQGNLRYRHYFRHDPTGDVIVLGDQCVRRMDFDSATGYKSAMELEKQRELDRLRGERETWEAANPTAADFLNAVSEETKSAGGSQQFIMDLHFKLYKYGSLSDKQTAAILNVINRQEEAVKDLTEIPDEMCEGRHKIEGEVLSFKYKDAPGFDLGRWTMTVLDDRGFKVWGTCPSGTAPEIDISTSKENGDEHPRVSFYATIQRKKGDKTFGFFKRPTKGTIVSITGEGNKDLAGYKED